MWKNAPDDITPYTGFVYLLKNKNKKKLYIGQKLFFFKKTLPALKGKKRKRRTLVESDWKTYTGSSNDLNADIAAGDEVEGEILHLAKSKWEMSYIEAREIIEREALQREDYYNGYLRLRIGKPPR